MDKKDLDEYMEALWYLAEEDDLSLESLQKWVDVTFDEQIIAELTEKDLIRQHGKNIELTPKGYEQAKQIVRCHRLAERLLADVLGMQLKEIEQSACEFEHIIAPEIADSICTLLGHPSECPHGLKIPEGNCCKQARDTLGSAIVPLSRVRIGDLVKVCYINTISNSRMHKLSHFGIIPGARVKVHQKSPSFVIQNENTQLAIEEEIADEIFVFYPEDKAESPAPQRRQWRFGRGRNRSDSE
ncbi:MAG: metal-dependent transcriptional regulator [Proteobacteria bacterium]|nr:metal-dependent transcriptional regulator [Pseudomonadota bacterium]